jgi:hypothetical protein
VVELAHTTDYVWMILIAAGVGAIGGLGAELLLQRASNTGTVELPGRLKGTRLVDIGFPASLIIGAIAAVAILYFFPPVVEKVTTGAGGAPPKSTHEYDLVKLVALSLIVGSAGPAFLTTAQARVMSSLNAQKADTAVETGKVQVEQMAVSATSAVPAAVQHAISEQIPDADASVVQAVADAASASVQSTLGPQVQAAQKQMAAIAKGSSISSPGTDA